MSVIDDVVRANAAHNSTHGPVAAPPARRLAVVTCMDARLDLLGPLGLQVGDAHQIRNAGGLVTHDVLRSLAISQRALGTREIALLHHTGCGMGGFDDAAFRTELATESGAQPPWDEPGFDDVHAAVRSAVARVRECPWLPHRDEVRGFVYDVATDRIAEVS